ncbi:hypothetical protein LKMONMHP_3026 [Methylobacterium organophilum]|uniref:Uncharacterized protein n=2 Tax=Methylobacterium organophilum TaxID=410 RepID=A0ABQ4TBZ3_METOR|nr:hypothetical protein LKMONMHP_3026 [Methylobacterium organophilum]
MQPTRKISTMSIRIVLAALTVTAATASPALAQGAAAESRMRAAAPTLQGQKAWDFLASSPAANPRDPIVKGADSVRARGSVERPAR